MSNYKDIINMCKNCIMINYNKKERDLLDLYKMLLDLEAQYITEDSLLKKMEILGQIRDVREEINIMEGESDE